MLTLLIRIALAFLVLNHLFTPCTALRSSSGGRSYNGGKYNEKGSKYSSKGNTFTGSSVGIPGDKITRRGLGISAWGIIMVIVTMIVAGMGFYYFKMCYPILCKKERKYDIIQMAHV